MDSYIYRVSDTPAHVPKTVPELVDLFHGGHSDNFTIGSSNYYQQALARQFDIFAIPADERPEIRGLHDPYDYLRPGLATFSFKDKVWRETPAGKSVPSCPFRGDHDD